VASGRILAPALAAIALAYCPAAQADPTITIFTGGMGGGLSVSAPHTITQGPGDVMWFTESNNPGRVVRFTVGANEFTGGLVAGFTADATPHRIAVGPDGNMWFSESANPGGLARITPTGVVTELRGGVTPNFPVNETPAGLTAGPDGNVWMVTTGNPGRILRVTPAGAVTTFTGGVTGGFSANTFPVTIVTGPDGNLWFAEAAGQRIGRVNLADGGPLTVTEFSSGITAGSLPQWITVGPDGALWFTEGGNPGGIGRITTSGAVTEFRPGTTPGLRANAAPAGIAAGPDGNLWFVEVTDPGRIVRITPEGVVTAFTGGVTPGLPANGFPISIAAGYDGQMWFTMASFPGRIGKITVGPGVTTEAAGGVGAASATLNGSVRPNGQATSYRFEYGRTDAYGSETTATAAGSGVAARDVSAAIAGLSPTTRYHYRVVASNDSGTGKGADRTFTTDAATEGGGGPAPRLALGGLRLSRTAFAAARSGPSAKAVPRRRSSTGTVISYSVERAATVRFTVERCVQATRRKRGRPLCARYRKLRGSFTHNGAAGRNRLQFTGRLRHRRLRAARYRLIAIASAGDRGGAPKRVAFRVIKPRRTED
jgi:streptogramin lyase